MLRTTLSLAVVAACAALTTATAQAGYTPPPGVTSPIAPITKGLPASCAELVNGTSGSAAPKGSTPPVRTGPATLTPSAAELAALPTRVSLRDEKVSYNDYYDVAAHGGHLYVRGHTATGLGAGPWQQLVLPPCIEGRVVHASIDGELMNVTDKLGNVYVTTRADEALERTYESWTTRWGAVIWRGDGVRIPDDAVDWSMSNGHGEIDKWFLDGAGNKSPIIGIATIYALGRDGRIVLLDPWLGSDESFQSCTPQGGRFHADALSASTQTMFVGGPDGSLYTRTWDFDISGADIVQLKYSWEDQRGLADPKIQLPALEWAAQPKVPGRTTNRLSITRTGEGSLSRELRVEGLDAKGRVGYWVKPITARGAKSWTFVVTGGTLQGKLRARHGKPLKARPSQALDYATTLPDGTRVQALGVDPYCSPGTLRLTAKTGQKVDLKLHSVDGLRQALAPAGWFDSAREKFGAIEVPKAVMAKRASLAAPLRSVIDTILAGQPSRFREVNLQGTRGSLWIESVCWKLKRINAGKKKVPAGHNPVTVNCAPAARR